MDIVKCEAFLASIDKGSFSAAASELGYTPSGITRMVNTLEAELGFPLLARSTKGVALTPNGETMLPIIREMLRWHEQANQVSSEIRGLSTGTITIGTYYSIAACWLPEVISRFQEDYPGIRIHTIEGGNSDLIEALEQHKVDFCLFSERSLNCEWIPLKKDALVAWLPKNHPYATAPAFPLQKLNGTPFIKTLPDCDTDLEELLDEEGLEPEIRFTTVDNYSTYAMVAAGLGVSINNELMAKNWTGDVVIKPFEPPRFITLGIAVCSLRHASPAAKKFISYTVDMLKDSNESGDVSPDSSCSF